MEPERGETVDPTYAVRVGERLRAIRLQKRLSLHEVERASQKEFKASVLGAYERGERSISVPRLQRLAQFYGVPADRLLPQPEDRVITLDTDTTPGPIRITVDLEAINRTDAPEAAIIGRFVQMIQVAREDFNGRVMSIRADDVRALAAVLATSSEQLGELLSELGLRAPAAP
ncbi:MAG: transcriptional regulator [Actinomycetota bacterium]